MADFQAVIDVVRGQGVKAMEAEPRNVSVKRHESDGRVRFKYSAIESDTSLPEVLASRGLILDSADDFSVVSPGFPKFFNLGESESAELDWSSARALEKFDGSCVVLYPWRGEWVPHTLGSIEGKNPVQLPKSVEEHRDASSTFGELFWEAWEKVGYRSPSSALNHNYWYVFELCTPYNRIVTPYEDWRLPLISVRSRHTFGERDPREFDYFFEVPRSVSVQNPDGVLELFEDLEDTDEGFVVADSDFNRVKMKQDSYFELHKLATGTLSGKHGILEAVLNEVHDDLLGIRPDLKDVVEAQVLEINEAVRILEEKFEEIDARTSTLKEFAIATQAEFPGSAQHVLFYLHGDDGGDSALQFMKNGRAKHVYRILEGVVR